MKAELIYQDIMNARVCSDGTWDETCAWLNTHHPAGETLQWEKKTDPPSARPITCNDDPGRTHYMFIC